MQVVVAVPPIEDFYFTRHRFSSLGALIVCDILSDMGVTVDFFNFPLLKKKGSPLALPKELGYLEPFIIENETGRLSYFTHYQHFGPPIHECVRMLCAKKPLMCLLSCFAFSYTNLLLSLAEGIKRMSPEIPIVIGGAGVSALPRFFIKNSSIDFVIVGEAEVSLQRFIRAFQFNEFHYSDIPNLFWKKGGKIFSPQRIQFTQSQDLRLIVNRTLETKKSIYFTTSLTRGCSKKCHFCSVHLTHGNMFRTVPVERIRDTLSTIQFKPEDAHKKIFFNFEDDNLLIIPDYFYGVMQIVKDAFKESAFYAENGVDYTLLTPEIVQKMIQDGMMQFNLSLVSTDQALLKRQNRMYDPDLYEKIVHLISEYSIPCITYFICGFKEDTRETIVRNLLYLSKQQTLIGVSLYYAVPGIGEGDQLSQNEHFFNDTSDKPIKGMSRIFSGSSAYPWTGSLSTRSLITTFRLSRLINLMKNPRKTEIEERLISIILKTKKLHTLIKDTRLKKNKLFKENKIIEVAAVDQELVQMFFNQL